MLNNTAHKCWDGIKLLSWCKKENKWRVVHSLCARNLLSVTLGAPWLKKNTHKNNHPSRKVASRFIGFGEQPGSSAEGLPLWQFNRCHSFCHIKDRRGRRRAGKLRHATAGFFFEVQGCRPSRSFPTLSRTSGIQSCCFYWPWTFSLFCWPFTSELWTTDPGHCAVCLKEWNFWLYVCLDVRAVVFISQVQSLHNTASLFSPVNLCFCIFSPVWGFQGGGRWLFWVLWGAFDESQTGNY